MKLVIFAGGIGSRLSEETTLRPKPMIEIGGYPILWHIMKIYSHYGVREFVLCLGYKGYMIKEWFSHYSLHQSDFTIDLLRNKIVVNNKPRDDWKVTLVDTGLAVHTATRLAAVRPYIGDTDFMLTYGDGLSDIDISKLVAFHKQHNKIATVTAIQPEGRFGSLKLGNDDSVKHFSEKVDNQNSWVNGGFFILRPAVFDYLPKDDVMWEREPLEKLAGDNQLMAYKHHGFWKAMDTLRDKNQLEELWTLPTPPWKVWKD